MPEPAGTDRWWETADRPPVRAPAATASEAARAVLTSLGVPPADAAVTVRQLIEADLRGYPAHGLERMIQIMRMLRRGTLHPRPAITEQRTTSATAIVDGGGGLGPPAVNRAVLLARRIVAEHGIAAVGVRGAGHIGILTTWIERAAGDDSLALLVSSSEPGVVLPGGTTPLFGTNPLAFGWPDSGGRHVVADFSTSAVSRSELLRRAQAGLPLPPGAGVDRAGRPTSDARAALDGGLLPFGVGHKGVLLSLLLAMLAGPVVGGPAGHEVTGTRHVDMPANKADLLLVVRLDAMTTVADFGKRAEDFLAALEADPATGFHRPGRAGAARRDEALAAGIGIRHDVAQLLWPPGGTPHDA